MLQHLVTFYQTYLENHRLATSPLGLLLPLGNPAADLRLVRSCNGGL